MKVSDMNWEQVEAWLKENDLAILPLGSTEQHAGLSLSVDSILAEKIALDAADAATDITSEYNKVKREHKKLEAKVKQIHRYTTIIFGSSILASVVAIGFSSVLYFKSMSDLSVMTTTNREALVIFAENVDALKETTNNLRMAMDNQSLIQDQNKKVLNKIEVMRDDFKTTTTSMQTQVKSANEQLSGEIANFSGQQNMKMVCSRRRISLDWGQSFPHNMQLSNGFALDHLAKYDKDLFRTACSYQIDLYFGLSGKI